MQTFEARTSASATVSGYYVNKASVTGINASASYTYQVGNDDGWSPVYSYHAPTDNPDKLTFLVTADAQIGQSDMEDASVTAERWDSVSSIWGIRWLISEVKSIIDSIWSIFRSTESRWLQ